KAWRAKAISVLEGLERRSALTDDDRFLLAQLFDQNGQWPKARDHYGNLVADHPNNQVFLAGYVQRLLQHREWDTALRWLDRLEQVEKQNQVEYGTYGTVELRARLLEGQGESDKAVALFQWFAEQPGAQPERILGFIHHLCRYKRLPAALK